MASITNKMSTVYIPLSYTLLSTASESNNLAAFPNGAGDGAGE
jgi:hypothetical protein